MHEIQCYFKGEDIQNDNWDNTKYNMLQMEKDTMQMGIILLQTMHSCKLTEKGFTCI